MIVFRVQDLNGRGPFKPGFSSKWVEPRDDHQFLVPWFIDLSRVDKQVTYGLHAGAACGSIDQLRRWFTAAEYEFLKKHGYQAYEIEVDRVIGESEIQLVFERVLPLNVGVFPFDLYPADGDVGGPGPDVCETVGGER